MYLFRLTQLWYQTDAKRKENEKTMTVNCSLLSNYLKPNKRATTPSPFAVYKIQYIRNVT